MWWLARLKLVFLFFGVAVHAAPITVNIVDPKILNNLEMGGYSLAQMLGGSKAESKTSDLYKNNTLYRSFADTIGKPLAHDAKTDQLPAKIPPGQGDIPEMVRLIRGFEDKGKRSDNDRKNGYFIRHLANNSQYPYQVEYDGDEPRHFDYRWLNSPFAYFKLIAVINRMDRMDFDPSSCGEVRFIYRLSYASPKSSSTLPFFINVVQQFPKQDDCSPLAQNWTENFKKLRFKQMEVNFQSLRFTSGYMHDFGGQAMYMQRIFKKEGDKLAPMPLENTPDVLAIENDPKLMARFVEFLKTGENLKKLDEGRLVIDFDPRFLTKFSVSWSTLGRARTANKPFQRLFASRADLLKSIDISKLKYVRSHAALVERLDNLTCMGCHQSSGTAGFHTLGFADPKFSHVFNKQELAFSPHAMAETLRRAAYVQALAEKREPNRFRQHSNIPAVKTVPPGQMCVKEQGHFASAPGCAVGSTCQLNVTNKNQSVIFGECIPTAPNGGAVCWAGEITENLTLPKDRGAIPSFNLFAFQDKWKMSGAALKPTGEYKCVLPQSGAPLGRMSRRCSLAEENFDRIDGTPSELCANQGGTGFDMCAATGDSGACLETKVARSMLDTCHATQPCREDYICQKFPEYQKISAKDYIRKKSGKLVNLTSPEKIKGTSIAQLHSRGIGFCVPTYFLFNMRLDGHPSPVTGMPPGEPKVDRKQPVRGYL